MFKDFQKSYIAIIMRYWELPTKEYDFMFTIYAATGTHHNIYALTYITSFASFH